jgi:hypothetical protein
MRTSDCREKRDEILPNTDEKAIPIFKVHVPRVLRQLSVAGYPVLFVDGFFLLVGFVYVVVGSKDAYGRRALSRVRRLK